ARRDAPAPLVFRGKGVALAAAWFLPSLRSGDSERLYFRAATLRREPPDEAAFVFLAAALAGFFPCASATLARSASSRSTTGAFSSTGSGSAISSPASFASSRALRSRRYSLTSSCG